MQLLVQSGVSGALVAVACSRLPWVRALPSWLWWPCCGVNFAVGSGSIFGATVIRYLISRVLILPAALPPVLQRMFFPAEVGDTKKQCHVSFACLLTLAHAFVADVSRIYQ